MGSQDVAQRWLKTSRALSKDDQMYGQRLAEMSRRTPANLSNLKTTPESCDFSVLIELQKEKDEERSEMRIWDH